MGGQHKIAPAANGPTGGAQGVLFSSAYLAPVTHYARALRAGALFIDQHEHYVKQSYRNRCVIAAESGPLPLTIPTQRAAGGKAAMHDVRISEHGNWRHLHWNAIESAYRNSPFFEYYADDLLPFYRGKTESLMDFNLSLHRTVCSLIGIELEPLYTQQFYRPADGGLLADLRSWSEPGNAARVSAAVPPVPYYQVFQGKHGFLAGLSILDLLFNMGPESLIVLHRMASQII